MTPSLEATVLRLSHAQREFLVGHVDEKSINGMRPFVNDPIENTTRRSLVVRGLVRFEPKTASRLGVPAGTMLTDDGHQALHAVLGECADALMKAYNSQDRFIDRNLYTALADALIEGRKHELRQQAISPPPKQLTGHAYDRPAVPAPK